MTSSNATDLASPGKMPRLRESAATGEADDMTLRGLHKGGSRAILFNEGLKEPISKERLARSESDRSRRNKKKTFRPSAHSRPGSPVLYISSEVSPT